jgi:hypothetical protein
MRFKSAVTTANLLGWSSATVNMTCLGEFIPCEDLSSCVMDVGLCGKCQHGAYLCPSTQAKDTPTCVPTAADYVKCPDMKGTHLDWTMDAEARVDYIVAHTDLATQVRQLNNNAEAIFELGIPAYQVSKGEANAFSQRKHHRQLTPRRCYIPSGLTTTSTAWPAPRRAPP